MILTSYCKDPIPYYRAYPSTKSKIGGVTLRLWIVSYINGNNFRLFLHQQPSVHFYGSINLF